MSFERLEGKIAVLTGVGRQGQVGEVVARAFASRGARVALLDRDVEAVRARAAELQGDGFQATAYPCDLTDPSDAGRVADEVRATASGGIDALVNLAGGFAMSGPLTESDPAVLQKQLGINLLTAYFASRAFVPLLRERRGSVVYFASAAVLPGGGSLAKMSAYAVAKAGVVALMRAVADEERAHGVRANAIAPTAIRTGDNVRDMGDDERYVERDEVASAVLYLCSEAARPISGQVLRLG
jgi:NAD(P)-dependent dehydrogenase (short-subunit alcohol dehydrogenase family)